MTLFLLRRLFWTVVMLWGVFTVTFFLMRAVPGGPLDRERQLEPEIRANLEKRFHLDESLPRQYWRELKGDLSLDLGYSFRLGDFSVNEVIAQGLPVSASLGILAMEFALLVGISAGVASAVWRGTAVDYFVMALATLGIAIPSFVVAAMAIILFVFIWPLFPAGGWGTLQQLVLPAICLGAPYAAYIARLSRAGMLDVLSKDYIRTARAKGLPRHSVILRHALRTALLPVVSFLGPATVGIVTGSLVVEKIFYIPGLGVHFVEAASQRDYTLSMGVVLVYTVLLALMNLLVDVAYRLLDPRLTFD